MYHENYRSSTGNYEMRVSLLNQITRQSQPYSGQQAKEERENTVKGGFKKMGYVGDFIIEQENTYKIPLEIFQAVIRNGEAAKTFKAHDKIVLTFDAREELHEIIGIDAEELVDKTLKHSVTIQPVRLIGEERAFDEDGFNDWSKCSLRKYINSTEFMSRYTENIEKYAALVIKKNGNYEDTQDRFFLLSKDEVLSKYPAFKTARDRIKTNLNGETDWHRLRSAHRGYANYAWYVLASGSVGSSSAIYAYRFAPAWVVA